MAGERPDAGRDGGDPGAWALLLAIPLMLLCCGGPLLVGIPGTGALAAFWAHGYGYLGIALLVLAGGVLVVWRLRRPRGAACCPPPLRASGATGSSRPAPDTSGPGPTVHGR